MDEQENNNKQYKIFTGSDIMNLHGIDIIYIRKIIQWDDCYAPMRTKTNTHVTDENSDKEPEGLFLANDQNDPSPSKHVRDTATRVSKILDAKYEKSDLPLKNRKVALQYFYLERGINFTHLSYNLRGLIDNIYNH